MVLQFAKEKLLLGLLSCVVSSKAKPSIYEFLPKTPLSLSNPSPVTLFLNPNSSYQILALLHYSLTLIPNSYNSTTPIPLLNSIPNILNTIHSPHSTKKP